MKYYQLKRAAEDRKRWHGLVVNLAQETTLQKGMQFNNNTYARGWTQIIEDVVIHLKIWWSVFKIN